MRRLPPLWRGVVVVGLLELLFAAGLMFWLRRDVREPQPGFMGDLAGVGATMFVAFVVAMAAILLWSTRYTPDEDALSGESVGIGFAALIGIGFALALSNHGEHHHLSWIEEFAFAWTLVSLFMLGIIVAAYPLMVYERNRPKTAREIRKST